MDTFAEITCFSSSRESAVEAMKEAFKEIERIEKAFNRFDEKSELSKINRLAGLKEVKINPELFKIIEHSIYYSRLSEGNFDITVLPLVDIWKDARKENFIPDAEVIKKTLEYVGYENIILNKEKSSIRFLNRNTKIDLGGVVKGYAVDKAKGILSSHGIKDALINIGGNILALGSPPGKKSWKIGIQHPRDKNDIIYRLNLQNRAISTSGDYERFFILNRKRFSHIINPVKGEPATGIMSVTIVAPKAEDADILSTAVFVMGVEDGLKFIETFNNTEVFIFDKDGKFIKYP